MFPKNPLKKSPRISFKITHRFLTIYPKNSNNSIKNYSRNSSKKSYFIKFLVDSFWNRVRDCFRSLFIQYFSRKSSEDFLKKPSKYFFRKFPRNFSKNSRRTFSMSFLIEKACQNSCYDYCFIAFSNSSRNFSRDTCRNSFTSSFAYSSMYYARNLSIFYLNFLQ